MKPNSTVMGLLAASVWAVALPLRAADKPAESVTFQENKVWILAGADKTEATNEIVFPGEIKINTNGVFTVKGGKDRQLKTGDVLAADGMLSRPDGSIVPVEDHLVAHNGRVDLVKDGESTPLASAYKLPDNSRVQPHGEIYLPNGMIRRMLDGQFCKLNGTTIPATDTAQLQGGKVTLFKDGDRLVLRPSQVMMMSDGSRVSGDGSVVRFDGTTERLQEGQILKFAGPVAPKKY